MNQNDSNLTTIFIHSSFRTGSTYVRSRFRANPGALSFQEIFHEQLATIRQEEIVGINFKSWHSKHPRIAPYFLEFHPFVSTNEKGVDNFCASMSYENFFSNSKPLPDEEAVYINQFIEYAQQLGKVPVITCTRTLGRMTAIKQKFNGIHIVIYRNIFDQWRSYTEQWCNGNCHFIDSIWRTLNGKHNDEIATRISSIYKTSSRSAMDPNNFFAFILLHLYLYSLVADEASLIIDIDEIASNSAVRNEVEEHILILSGLNVDFSDAKQSASLSLVDVGNKDILLDTINAFPEITTYPKTRRGKEFLEKVVKSLVDGYSIYSKINAPLIKEFTRQYEIVQSLRHQVQLQQDELLAERENLKGYVEREKVTDELRAQFHKQQDDLRLAREDLSKNLASISWRITRPLRVVRKLFGRCV